MAKKKTKKGSKGKEYMMKEKEMMKKKMMKH